MDAQSKETKCPPAFPSSHYSPHHHVQTEEIFDCSCSVCSYGRIWKELVGHREEDPNPTVNWVLSCEICSQSFQCLSGFIHHTSSQHPNKLFCPSCPFLAQNLVGFKAHMIAHSLNPSVPASPCNPENVANFQAQTPASTCQESPEEFESLNLTFDPTTADKEIPKRTSTKNEFRCANCSDTFTQKWSLRRHENKCKTNNLRSHSCTNSREKGFKCHNFGCDYKGRRVHHLQTHQRSCRGRNPILAAAETSDEVAVVAVVDRRSGGTPDYLTEKASINKDEPQFNCSICTFRCQSRSRLKTHLIAHTSQRPFRCPIEGCNFQTKWSYNVRIHCRALHYMESSPKAPLQTEDFGPVKECQTEAEVDTINSCSSMAFACMLCDFVGDSELSALEHARQHTAVYVPLGPTH